MSVYIAGPELSRLLRPDPPPFAILRRPEATGLDQLELLIGDVSAVPSLADLPLPSLSGSCGTRPDLLALVPYRQIAERGFACRDDSTPLLALIVRRHALISVDELARCVPDTPIELRGGRFDIDDKGYTSLVRAVISDEIGRGEGSNFVIRRSYQAMVGEFTPLAALALFLRLVRSETGAYWTFVVYTGNRFLIGASPERHVSLAEGTVTMNPISGTYRYPTAGPTVAGALRFLSDQKEADELYMVVDEELKMMGRLCSDTRVVGPYLKEMGKLAHTEYLLTGHSSCDVREILRETMFAPTVTGSPLESACRAITRHERSGRGYYSGMLALIERDGGRRSLDSSIMIRTADIDQGGNLTIGVGATLVRHSDAAAEAAETRAKAQGLLAAIGGHRTRSALSRTGRLATDTSIRNALAARNQRLSRFWLQADEYRHPAATVLSDCHVLVVDAEDTFTAMLDHQLRSLGTRVTTRRYDMSFHLHDYDIVVVGPGPGDPRDDADPKIAILRDIIHQLLDKRHPFLAVCLGHQVLSWTLGLEVVRLPAPNQGVQRQIGFFGRSVRVGFYNSFAARCDHIELRSDVAGRVRVCREPSNGVVHGLWGESFQSMQFHAESVLTEDGPAILARALTAVGAGRPSRQLARETL